jgi:hypothetical protein
LSRESISQFVLASAPKKGDRLVEHILRSCHKF